MFGLVVFPERGGHGTDRGVKEVRREPDMELGKVICMF
jgi:hypothetical protein